MYKDEHVAVADKSEVLIMVGAKREDLRSVLPFILSLPAPAVLHRPHRLSGKLTGPLLPRPVHRLDRCTSRLVVVAKTDRAVTALRRSFADWSVRKS